ncbi:MAG: hypothetical protein ACAH12_04090 [Methylophilaceae bacterium]
MCQRHWHRPLLKAPCSLYQPSPGRICEQMIFELALLCHKNQGAGAADRICESTINMKQRRIRKNLMNLPDGFKQSFILAVTFDEVFT